VRTGPWSTTAFLIGPIEDTRQSVEVSIWLSSRELPGYAPRKQVPYTLEYRAAGKTIRTYKFQVAGRKISRIGPNKVGYAGADALPPQSLIADKPFEEFWLEPIR